MISACPAMNRDRAWRRRNPRRRGRDEIMTPNPGSAIMSGQTDRIASVGPSLFVVILARVTVFATFLLLIAGALVTGNKAAMADPTWPKFVDSWWPRFWVGGLLYEDSHRI